MLERKATPSHPHGFSTRGFHHQTGGVSPQGKVLKASSLKPHSGISPQASNCANSQLCASPTRPGQAVMTGSSFIPPESSDSIQYRQ